MNGLNSFGPADVWWAREWTVGSLHPGDQWLLIVRFKAMNLRPLLAVGGEVLPVSIPQLYIPFILIGATALVGTAGILKKRRQKTHTPPSQP